MFLSFISWETIGQILLFPVLILLPGVAIAAMAGLPTFFLVRTWESYAAVAADYRAAVGLPPRRPFFENGGFHNPWIDYLMFIGWAVSLVFPLSPVLEFSILVLACARVVFYFFHRAVASWTLMRAHPGLDRRLKRVPITEICAYGAAAVLSLAAFLNIVVQGPPKPSSAPTINQAHTLP